MLNLQASEVAREVGAARGEAHRHWRRCLVWVVEIVPWVCERRPETEGPVKDDSGVHIRQDLLPVREAVEGRVLDRDEHVSNRVVRDEVSGFRHPELPRGCDAHSLEREEHLRGSYRV